MDVLGLLDKELQKYGSFWTTEEKVRYIYLRSCELFTYDPRFYFCKMDMVEYSKELEKEIKNAKFDLSNITDKRVICTTWANEIFSVLLKKLLGLNSDINGSNHQNVIFNDGKIDILADATIKNDLTRVKMGLNTLGYKPMIKDSHFNKQLMAIDKNIHYIRDNYENENIKRCSLEISRSFLESYQTSLNRSFIADEALIEKMYTIKEMYEGYHLQFYFDCQFCISYLFNKFFNDEESSKMHLYELFMNEEEYWDFLNIYTLQLFQDTLYFVLKKGEFGYDFYEIPYSEVKSIANYYDGMNKSLLIK